MRNNTTLSNLLKQNAKLSILLGCLSTISQAAFAQNSTQHTGPSVAVQHAIISSKSAVGISAEFVAQSYSDVSGNITGTGMQFGGGQNLVSSLPESQPIWAPLDGVSNPAEELFTNASFSNGASFSIFNTTRPLAAAALPTNGRYLMGQLKLRFDKPVDNPTLQLVGLGGAAGDLGFSSELELMTQNISLSKLSGNANLEITGGQITNKAENPDAASTSGAASGSVLVSGAKITELTFNIYMRGNGAGNVWEQAGSYLGDRWQIGCSLNEQAEESAKTPTALPVYVSNFMVNQEEECAATLRWSSITELGITSFVVEQSVDGITFQALETFESDGGAEGKHYRYVMEHASGGNNYFRVKINNNLAQNGYSVVRPINIQCHAAAISVQPNPSSNFITVKGVDAGSTLSLYNMSGREVRTAAFTEPETILNISDLHEGIYMLIVRDAQGIERSRTRVQKI